MFSRRAVLFIIIQEEFLSCRICNIQYIRILSVDLYFYSKYSKYVYSYSKYYCVTVDMLILKDKVFSSYNKTNLNIALYSLYYTLEYYKT